MYQFHTGEFAMLKLVVALPACLLSAVALAQQPSHEHAAVTGGPSEAVVVLVPMKNSGVNGTLTLTQHGNDVVVKGKITGLKPGKHGFHIHQFGDLRDGEGKSAGGHYNPSGAPHAGPEASAHHAGDLGNVDADSKGIAEVNKTVDGLKLQTVIGRSMVVHADADDLMSQPSGNAGARVAVGVIGIAEAKHTAAAAK
ncbi:MAG: superoxide dismutase family protein [Pirellulales bacterium]|nr:superoxide dismutase family protein [Pirellulales bacterium]